MYTYIKLCSFHKFVLLEKTKAHGNLISDNRKFVYIFLSLTFWYLTVLKISDNEFNIMLRFTGLLYLLKIVTVSFMNFLQ